jgi:hypothetical protein
MPLAMLLAAVLLLALAGIVRNERRVRARCMAQVRPITERGSQHPVDRGEAGSRP